MTDYHDLILKAYADPQSRGAEAAAAVEEMLCRLNKGELRVAEPGKDGAWSVNEWVKKGILLSFQLRAAKVMDAGYTRFYDKFGTKFSSFSADDFQRQSLRVVPPAVAREGCYLAKNVVLMPCYINIGAYVDSGSLIDTWATVGSCAQIGKNVHLSGGAGIGGVLEPLQALPTIIEDDCFIGARSEIVEGVHIRKGAVISMGVFISRSTPIYNRMTQETGYGCVPAGSVVVPGSLPSADGSYGRAAAIIVKQVDERTRKKVSLNELLRDEDFAE